MMGTPSRLARPLEKGTSGSNQSLPVSSSCVPMRSPLRHSLFLPHLPPINQDLALDDMAFMSEIIGENLGFLDSSEKSQSNFNSSQRNDGLYSAYNPPRLNLFASMLTSQYNSLMDLGSPS